MQGRAAAIQSLSQSLKDLAFDEVALQHHAALPSTCGSTVLN
ncbi:hypothetical protein [Synechococcus sp. MU1642]|nr:hypothetical protein [Synechococcus sp. MU1642]